jgi:uncharacterized iron-regulated membrane protein
MRPTISPAFSRAVLDGHSLLGVIFGALVYIVCFSGALIVLVDQLTLWERPEIPIVREGAVSPMRTRLHMAHLGPIIQLQAVSACHSARAAERRSL